MPPYTRSRSAVLAALIDGQRNRLRNEAAWRQEDPLSEASPEPADPAPALATAVPPRPEPQINLPHLGDIWDRMQQEKQSLGAINLYRMGQGAKAGIFGPRGMATTGAAEGLPGHRSAISTDMRVASNQGGSRAPYRAGEFASPSSRPLPRHEPFTTSRTQVRSDRGDESRDDVLHLARVPQWVADLYFRARPEERRNLEGNVQRLIGGKLDSGEVTTILKDVLAEDKTGMGDLQAFSGVVPAADGRVQLTPAQKEIVDRFVNGHPNTPLNRSAVQLYRAGPSSGRIRVKNR
jgi:hypothetical protein